VSCIIIQGNVNWNNMDYITHQHIAYSCKIIKELGGKICFRHTLLKPATVEMGTHPWSSIKAIR
jgi:hypothetical protein